uniref:hypothetical protein n=1 Tax=Falsiroseomonas oryzae TaxID=2766473 RepID=UPI0022EB07E2
MAFVRRVWISRASGGGAADAPFIEERPARPQPARRMFTAHEEAESLARWHRARRHLLRPDAPTAREITTLGIFAAALVAMRAAERAWEFGPVEGADAAGDPASGQGDGRFAAFLEDLASTTGVSWRWTPDPGPDVVGSGTGAEVAGPSRLVPGGSAGSVVTEPVPATAGELLRTPTAAIADPAVARIAALPEAGAALAPAGANPAEPAMRLAET